MVIRCTARFLYAVSALILLPQPVLHDVRGQRTVPRTAQGKQKQGGSTADAASPPDRETMPNFGRTAQLGRLSPDKGAARVLNPPSSPCSLFASPAIATEGLRRAAAGLKLQRNSYQSSASDARTDVSGTAPLLRGA